jgi:hypothetical protein
VIPSWDRLEEELVTDRERRIGALLDVVEAMAGTAPTVVDLACGPGTIGCSPDGRPEYIAVTRMTQTLVPSGSRWADRTRSPRMTAWSLAARSSGVG